MRGSLQKLPSTEHHYTNIAFANRHKNFARKHMKALFLREENNQAGQDDQDRTVLLEPGTNPSRLHVRALP